MEKVIERCAVVGGVDTHKDLHVAAVVDDQDRFLASQSFATTRQGYRLMLEWMRSFGDLQRVGIESTGTYGAGVLRYLQKAGVQILEVTGPDRHDPRPGKVRYVRRRGGWPCGFRPKTNGNA